MENKDENVHRFALSAIRGELLERKREFWDFIHGLPIIHSKDYERDRERERKERGKWERKKRKRDQNIIIKDKNINCDISRDLLVNLKMFVRHLAVYVLIGLSRLV